MLVEIIRKHDLMPTYTQEDLQVIKENRVDFLGVNYYQPVRVCAKANMPNPDAHLHQNITLIIMKCREER